MDRQRRACSWDERAGFVEAERWYRPERSSTTVAVDALAADGFVRQRSGVRQATCSVPPCLRPFGGRKNGSSSLRNLFAQHMLDILRDIKPLRARLGDQGSFDIGRQMNSDG